MVNVEEKKLTPEEEIKRLKKKINIARAQLNSPLVASGSDQQQRQLLYDQISEYNRQIEQLTRATRRVVPVSNAPIVADRTAVSSRAKRRKSGHFSSL